MVGNDPINWVDPFGLKGCAELALEIVVQAGKLAKEWAKYDPVADAKGGFIIPGQFREVGGRLYPKRTKPGGHYKEMMELKRGLWNRLTDFKRDCWDDDDCPKPPKIPVWVWDLARKPIPVPITPLNPFQEWARNTTVSNQTLDTFQEAAVWTTVGAATIATGGLINPYVAGALRGGILLTTVTRPAT